MRHFHILLPTTLVPSYCNKVLELQMKHVPFRSDPEFITLCNKDGITVLTFRAPLKAQGLASVI